jgi:hypothetical protein
MSDYKNPVCRGCWALGNNCGTCERCVETKPTSLDTAHEFRPCITEAYNRTPGAVSAEEKLKIAVEALKEIRHGTFDAFRRGNWLNSWASIKARKALERIRDKEPGDFARIAPEGGV